jgi:SAM-dependent methyltransferase
VGTDRAFLLEEQYRTSRNLETRIALHERFSTNPQPFPQWVFDQLPTPPDADVLEVGCGNGNLWHSNLDRIPTGWRLTLTDFSPGMVSQARDRLGGRASYAVADVQALPFADASFDLAIANHMLFHVPDRDRALDEIARVLRSGGAIIATTNGVDHLRELRAPDAQQWSRSFGLENGPAQLARVFVDVEVERFPDALEVTEVEPLVDFVRSLGFASEDHVARLAAQASAAIARDGSFRVSKSAGVLRAVKP